MDTELLMVPGTFELSEILGCMFWQLFFIYIIF